MSDSAKAVRPTTVSCLMYRDPNAAMQWLCDTFGFTQHAAYEDPPGRVVHAELTFGSGMVMLGSVRADSPYGKLVAQPDQVAGRETQTVYVVAADPDDIYRRAKAAGAKILLDIKDEDYGGRGFTCSDPEGHIWTVGSYDPWQPKPGAH